MEKNINNSFMLPALILSLGISFSGYQIGKSIVKIKTADRVVSVKGLAEKTVRANLVIWPVTFNVMSNDLIELQALIREKNKIIRAFLLKNGVKTEQIFFSSPKITDRELDYYNQNKVKFRYVAEATTTVRTEEVDKVNKIKEKTEELIKEGIVIVEGYSARTEYKYTNLNEIKPSMIEEATKNARFAAEKFAKDSESKLGDIKNAYQGLFSIEDIDVYTPETKVIRVITEVQYFLTDD